MPELPEVETVVRGLRRHLLMRGIQRVIFASERIAAANQPEWESHLRGRRIEAVERRGKYILVRLSGEEVMIVHLRMTGRLWVKPVRYRRAIHDRFILSLDDGRRLVLVDPRQFARVERTTADHLEEHPGLRKLGPDALTIGHATLRCVCKSSHRPIKALLLDQTRLAGLGNIYADECLFRARIRPATPADSLGLIRIERLRTAITSVLTEAIELCGTTFDTFSDVEGTSGGFGPHLMVYRRTGQPCLHCGAIIRRIVISGRGTHFCPRCQAR